MCDLLSVISCVSAKLPQMWFQTAVDAANALARVENWFDQKCNTRNKKVFLVALLLLLLLFLWLALFFFYIFSHSNISERWPLDYMTRKAGSLLLLLWFLVQLVLTKVKVGRLIKNTSNVIVVVSPSGLSVREYLAVKDEWTGRWHGK